MKSIPHVLVITEDPSLELLATALEAESITAEAVGSREEAIAALHRATPCVCVVDSTLPGQMVPHVDELCARPEGQHTILLAAPGAAPPASAASCTRGM